MNTKELLHSACEEYLDKRLATIEKTMASHQKALTSETKSSAGDKHETGRAMIQLEMEKAGQQLDSIQEMKEILSKVDPSKTNEIGSLGALVETSQGIYFLSISAGQLQVHNEYYFAISTASPIGRLLLGKKKGEQLIWNGKEIKVHNIS